MELATGAQMLSSFAVLMLAIFAFVQVMEQREARRAQDSPQILVDVNYSQRTMINIVVRNIGRGAAKDINFAFSSPIESSGGQVVSELPYFKDGIAFLAPNQEIASVWDTYESAVSVLKEKGIKNGITVRANYKDLRGKTYSTEWTINPLLLEGSGYADLKEFEDLVRAVEKMSIDLREIKHSMRRREANNATREFEDEPQPQH
ncbi:MAG: hypothetical protein M3475_04850 [Actinomycetota bacterium]|jgi:hypothetical protein|nr:hypothetical protein [Actinomycetota bacterium]